MLWPKKKRKTDTPPKKVDQKKVFRKSNQKNLFFFFKNVSEYHGIIYHDIDVIVVSPSRKSFKEQTLTQKKQKTTILQIKMHPNKQVMSFFRNGEELKRFFFSF